MATINIYTRLQKSLYPFRVIFVGMSIVLIIFAFIVIASFEPGPVPSEKIVSVKAYILVLVTAALLGWLHGVSTYQKRSKLRQLPYIGKIINIAFGYPTAKSEALKLNFMFLALCSLIVVGGIMVFRV